MKEKDRNEGKQGGVLTSAASGKAEAQPNDGDWRLEIRSIASRLQLSRQRERPKRLSRECLPRAGQGCKTRLCAAGGRSLSALQAL